MDPRMATAFVDARICNEAPLGDTPGLTNPVIIAPGNPDQSILVLRMEDSAQHRMPPTRLKGCGHPGRSRHQGVDQ